MSNTCSICKLSSELIKVDEHYNVNGGEYIVPDTLYYECPKCREQFADRELTLHNSKLIKKHTT